MQNQPVVGVVQVQLRQRGNALQAIDQCIAVHIQRLRRPRQVAICFEESAERTRQIALFALVMLDQRTQRLGVELLKGVGIALFQCQQQLIQLQVAVECRGVALPQFAPDADGVFGFAGKRLAAAPARQPAD